MWAPFGHQFTYSAILSCVSYEHKGTTKQGTIGTISEKDAESMKAAGITVVQGAEGRAITAADNYLKQASAEELAALG